MPQRPRRKSVMTAVVVIPAVAAGGLAIGLSVAASQGALGGDPITGQALKEPPVVRSKNGRLAVTFTAKGTIVRLGGRNVGTWAYSSMVPGPTLVLNRGDYLQITSKNELPDQPTNLHTHGLHVSPKGQGDNVFVNSPSGNTFTNKYKIPMDHIPGQYWYHPHRHMYVTNQVAAGMAGSIIIKANTPEERELDSYRTRLMVFQDFRVQDGQVAQAASTAPLLTYVNGQLQPVVDIRRGEMQRWRLSNMQANNFLRIQVPAGMKAWMISTDGNPTSRPVPVDDMLLPPAGRRTILVRKDAPGDLTVQNIPWGSGKQAIPQQDLLTVRTQGAARATQSLPKLQAVMPDLRGVPVYNSRTVQFSVDPPLPGSTTPQFLINGMNYDAWGSKNLARMKLNTVEEWTLTNTSPEYHPFHIHIQPFQVVSINGVPVQGVEYRDTVPIPPMTNGVPGKVVIRQKYTDFTGRFVIHCHILFHEDNGMMAPVQVVK